LACTIVHVTQEQYSSGVVSSVARGFCRLIVMGCSPHLDYTLADSVVEHPMMTEFSCFA